MSAVAASKPSMGTHLYQSEDRLRLGAPLVVALILNVALVLCGFLSRHDNLLDLLKAGETEAFAPPPKEEHEVQMELDPVPPPPPEDNPEFVKPVEVVKQQETPPPPKPVPKPPAPAPAAPATNKVFEASAFKAGDPSLPKPPYPAQARLRHQQGTVMLSVTMVSGHVTAVSIAQSSGYGILDSTSRQWAEQRWTFPDKYSGTYQIPVDFQLAVP